MLFSTPTTGSRQCRTPLYSLGYPYGTSPSVFAPVTGRARFFPGMREQRLVLSCSTTWMLCWATTGLSIVVGNVISTTFHARADNNSIALAPPPPPIQSYVSLKPSLQRENSMALVIGCRSSGLLTRNEMFSLLCANFKSLQIKIDLLDIRLEGVN
jgi:hypothetical protein